MGVGPVGSIIAMAVNRGTEYDGWLLCNGQSIPAGTKYDALRNLLGSTYGSGKVPNFQGYFLRGYGGNSAEAGIAQEDQIRNIKGTFVDAGISHSDTALSVSGALFVSGGLIGEPIVDYSYTSSAIGFDANAGTESENPMAGHANGADIHPANYAVYYYIRY
jgi:microcystin-dependent protein